MVTASQTANPKEHGRKCCYEKVTNRKQQIVNLPHWTTFVNELEKFVNLLTKLMFASQKNENRNQKTPKTRFLGSCFSCGV